MQNVLEDVSQQSEQTPGKIIKAARHAMQISLDEVSQKLLLSRKILTAIEEDNYTQIPAAVYAEGYLKAYAKFLQIPVDDIIKNFRALNAYPGDDIKARVDVQKEVNIEWLLAIPAYLKKHNTLLLKIGLLVLLLGSFATIFLIKTKNNSSVSDTTSLGTATETEKVDVKAKQTDDDEDATTLNLEKNSGKNTSTKIVEQDSFKPINISIPLDLQESGSDNDQ